MTTKTIDKYISILKLFNTKRLDLLKNDLNLQKNGWKIYYAIDPHDISEFCFPFDFENHPTEIQKVCTEKDDLSKKQNGRFEAFYNQHKTIQLPSYKEEIFKIEDWARRFTYIRADIDIINQWLLLLNIPTGDYTEETRLQLEKLTEENISSIICLVTGIYSTGNKRLKNIIEKRLIKNLYKEFSSYSIELYDRINIQDIIANILEQRTIFIIDKFKRTSSNDINNKVIEKAKHIVSINDKIDAKAIDQLLQLNDLLNPYKIIIYYFSSSPKTYNIFSSQEIKPFLPNINKYVNFNLHRTPLDMFSLLINKSVDESGKILIDDTIKNIVYIEKLINDIKIIINNLRHDTTVHFEDTLNSEEIELNKKVTDLGNLLEEKSKKYINDSLIYKLVELLNKPMESSDKFSKLIEAINEVMKSKTDSKRIKDEIQDNIEDSLKKSFIISSTLSFQNKSNKHISCILNLPKLKIRNATLSDIQNRIITLLKEELTNSKSNLLENFEKVCTDFQGFTESSDWKNSNNKHQWELMRAYISYMVNQNNRAKLIIENHFSEFRNLNITNKTIYVEYLYLSSFIYRDLGEYKKAYEEISKAIELKPDPRLYLSRSLIIFRSFLELSSDISFNLDDGIKDSLKSIKLFSQKKPKDKSSIGVIFNNLAFVHSLSDFSSVDLVKAKKFITELTKNIPENEWDPIYSEFLHTKALCLFQEACDLSTNETSNIKDDNEKYSKIMNLLSQIKKLNQRSLEINPDKDARILLNNQIDNFINTIKIKKS